MSLIRIDILAKKNNITREAIYYYIKRYDLKTQKIRVKVEIDCTVVDEDEFNKVRTRPMKSKVHYEQMAKELDNEFVTKMRDESK